MKTKYFVSAIVSALALTAALPASAQDYRNQGRDNGYAHQDWRQDSHRGQITVRTQRGQFSVDRGDRLFSRLTDRPYRFRPGFTYIYTDRCSRDGCLVLEMNGWNHRVSDRFMAPPVRFERMAWNDDHGQWRQDNRDFSRDFGRDSDRRSDNRDFRGDDPTAPPSDSGRYNGNQGRNGALLGGPH